MTQFEKELKKALERREPRVGFESGLFEKLAREKPRFNVLFKPAWGFAAAMALAVLLVVLSLGYRQHVRAVEGEGAKRQLLIAMRIAGSELRETQIRIKHTDFPEVVMQ